MTKNELIKRLQAIPGDGEVLMYVGRGDDYEIDDVFFDADTIIISTEE